MQSQQKKIKWSRGEANSALEERQDTGVTQVSVESMINFLPNLYGNITRRPALKAISNRISKIGNEAISEENTQYKIFQFVISADVYYVIYVQVGLSVLNICRVDTSDPNSTTTAWSQLIISSGEEWQLFSLGRLNYTQYNNYALLTGEMKYPIKIVYNSQTNSLIAEEFNFSGPWYAPNATTSNTVSNLGTWRYDNNANPIYDDGINTVVCNQFSSSYNLLPSSSVLSKGDVLWFPNMGVRFRVYDWFIASSRLTLIGTNMTPVASISSTDTSFSRETGYVQLGKSTINKFVYNNAQDFVFYAGTPTSINNGLYNGEYTSTEMLRITNGDEFNFIVNQIVAESEPFYSSFINGMIISSVKYIGVVGNDHMFMTSFRRVSDSVIHDILNLTSLLPTNRYSTDTRTYSYSPKATCFNNQRLFIGNFAEYADYSGIGKNIAGSYSIGSHLGRYDDFLRDFDYDTEPVAIDIVEKFQTEINWIISYQGLKIFTNIAEWDIRGANAQSTVNNIRNSNNGSSELCAPLEFKSLLLYVDASYKNIRAMANEFSSQAFQSSNLTMLCQSDLVQNPICMSYHIEKTSNEGDFIFAIQPLRTTLGQQVGTDSTHSAAVGCIIPENNVISWCRMDFPKSPNSYNGDLYDVIGSAITMNNKTIFSAVFPYSERYNSSTQNWGYSSNCNILCSFDWDAILDFEYHPVAGTAYPIYYLSGYGTFNNAVRPIGVNLNVAVYDGDKFMWNDTTNAQGRVTKNMSALTNPKIGIPINAYLKSFPLDINGKTKSTIKRAAKALMVVKDTNVGAVTVNNKTGYMSPDNTKLNFYNITGMKDTIRYEIRNLNGAKCTIESLTLNMEYGTLIS